MFNQCATCDRQVNPALVGIVFKRSDGELKVYLIAAGVILVGVALI